MKKGINLLLTVCVFGLGYICVRSIMDTIEFDQERANREKVVIARLKDIRTAQVAFRDQNGGQYTESFDQLIDFVKNGKVPTIKKVGELTDKQLEDGMTEDKAVKMIEEARKAKPAAAKRKWKELEEKGIVVVGKDGSIEYLFSRDTMWIPAIENLFPEGINPDSLRYVPFGKNGEEFEMRTGCDSTNKSGTKLYLFEAKTPYTVYLNGMNKDDIFNLSESQKDLGRYPGLQVGDAEVGNNNAGNWE